MTLTTARHAVEQEVVEILLEAAAPLPRRAEPVTLGLPWPRGRLSDPARLRLHDDAGTDLPLQTRVLDSWPDGSVRWVLLDCQASVEEAQTCRLSVVDVPARSGESLALAMPDGG